MAREARGVRLPCIKVDNGRLQCTFTLLRTDCEGWQTPWCGCQQFQEIRSKSGGRTRAVRPGRRQTTECRAHCAGAIRARDKSSYLEGDSPTGTSSS